MKTQHVEDLELREGERLGDDGLVYGPEPLDPHVDAVEARDDHTLLLTFENGVQRTFDARPLLGTAVFAPLRDLAFFRQVRVIRFGIAWPGERDLAHDMLYHQSEPAEEGAKE